MEINFGDKYHITRDGRAFKVKPFPRELVAKNNGISKYFRWSMTVNGKTIHYCHRVVAEVYIPNPDNLPNVYHIDGDKTNNVVENLKWGTSKDCTTNAVKLNGSWTRKPKQEKNEINRED